MNVLYRECAHEQHVRRTLTLTVNLTIIHTITVYSLNGHVVCVRISLLICATRQLQLDNSRVEKRVYRCGILRRLHMRRLTSILIGYA